MVTARAGKLYPAVILHGGDGESRQRAAVELGRLLLCAEAPEDRPCGRCVHCSRIAWPGEQGDAFHPDFLVLERDLKTATSVEATRTFLRTAQVAPFEAGGQVFVVASAESLGGQAANALLKVLEEPPQRSSRHFLLLAPSRLDLLPTLRSRSLSVFLGDAGDLDRQRVEEVATELSSCLEAYRRSPSGLYLLAAAAALAKAGGWEDARADRPWSVAAASVVAAAAGVEEGERRRLLALAEDLLQASSMRVRGINATRILEGLVARHLAVA